MASKTPDDHYSHIRFIGHSLYTGPKSTWTGQENYVGLADANDDIDARVAVVARVLDTAREHIDGLAAGEHPPPTLNVFVLPEFYFRGAQGVYSPTEEARLQTGLRNLIRDPKWHNWLFVFGTYLSGWKRPNTPDPDDMMVNNVSMVQRGGFGSDDTRDVHCVTKEHKSSIDFIDKGEGVLERDVTYIDLAETGPGKEQAQSAIDGRGIFQLADVSYGVEICLDHLYRAEHDAKTGKDTITDVRRLWHSPQLPGERAVQVHIVTACGMSICPRSVVAMSKGWIFDCDGLEKTGKVDLRPVDEACKLTESGVYDPAGEATLGASETATELTIDTTGIEPDKLWRYGVGTLQVYAPVRLPPAARMPKKA